MIAEMKKPDLA